MAPQSAFCLLKVHLLKWYLPKSTAHKHLNKLWNAHEFRSSRRCWDEKKNLKHKITTMVLSWNEEKFCENGHGIFLKSIYMPKHGRTKVKTQKKIQHANMKSVKAMAKTEEHILNFFQLPEKLLFKFMQWIQLIQLSLNVCAFLYKNYCLISNCERNFYVFHFVPPNSVVCYISYKIND